MFNDIHNPFIPKRRVSSLDKYKASRICDLPTFDYKLDKVIPNKTALGHKSTVDWLRKRHKTTCRIVYLKSQKSRKVENLLQEMFNLVDIDKSGTIDIGELYSIFKFNHYNISRKSFNKIFSNVPFQQMNFEEFKSLCSPEGEMRDKFLEMIEEAKSSSTTKFFP
ncbi:unnamed protein product [Moneuplotes crassus]|uniref:EF-hand domain-containing protein n=1 Tax=Euplotes crassus TaxID=5936 RepID=A0AAD1UFX9_EUPCR|nr:unnamed protein product [Moneuplotes crassus]